MKKIDVILKKEIMALDKNGIWITKLDLDHDQTISQQKWEDIYDFGIKKLISDRKDFNENKLDDHLHYVLDSYEFTKETIYLEIGCGPSYVGEYLMKKYDVFFVGVDINYKILQTVKKYFDDKGFTKFILIHADITDLPLKNDSIDYIYGGGVIEHFKDTGKLLKELKRVLKKRGVMFNTIPAFNFTWLMRITSTIPSVRFLRGIAEYIHLNLLDGKLLDRHHGYELNFTSSQLISLHKKLSFTNITVAPFAFHPSRKVVKNAYMRKLFFTIAKIKMVSPIYFVSAQK